ncbi:hypothetical protein CEUSTIGMA_g12363.t1 [Chlamydomonas eustigma]|uniref:FHA domain-containing protein n=1 Tax=Chlamydomonas eustigma TaxID=1157962 RepID=A0A250XPT8_9CHLO|nr:hypothetical protein CEUSTIGMA_g12363.t1 [Chlamydomonas eustigma]|eukprot:GAX84942.1 hypothetical protein CEUSTIGMA_g12363.t1 [Chlamydomonas eustigma]
MWVLDVQLIVEPECQSAVQSYWLTGPLVTIGRPAKDPNAVGVDISIAGDSAVSKVHAELKQHTPQSLILTDLSRFGTWVNNQKLPTGSSCTLKDGDIVKMAVKVHMRVRWLAVDILIDPQCALGMAAEVQQLSMIIGGTLKTTWSEEGGITHLLTEEGAQASSTLVRAIITTGVNIIQRSWLHQVVSKPVWPHQLPSYKEHQPQSLSCHSILDPMCSGSSSVNGKLQLQDCRSSVYARVSSTRPLAPDFTIVVPAPLKDKDLDWCLRCVTASLVSWEEYRRLQPLSKPQQTVILTLDDNEIGRGYPSVLNYHPSISLQELLSCLLHVDATLLYHRIKEVSHAELPGAMAGPSLQQPPHLPSTASAITISSDGDVTEGSASTRGRSHLRSGPVPPCAPTPSSRHVGVRTSDETRAPDVEADGARVHKVVGFVDCMEDPAYSDVHNPSSLTIINKEEKELQAEASTVFGLATSLHASKAVATIQLNHEAERRQRLALKEMREKEAKTERLQSNSAFMTGPDLDSKKKQTHKDPPALKGKLQDQGMDPRVEVLAPLTTYDPLAMNMTAPRVTPAAMNDEEGAPYTEVVGPGHTIMYLPLTIHQLGAASFSNSRKHQQHDPQQQLSALPNYKVFRKSCVGAVSSNGAARGAEVTSHSSLTLASADITVPMFVYDATSSRTIASRADEAELMLRAEKIKVTQRQKRGDSSLNTGEAAVEVKRRKIF